MIFHIHKVLHGIAITLQSPFSMGCGVVPSQSMLMVLRNVLPYVCAGQLLFMCAVLFSAILGKAYALLRMSLRLVMIATTTRLVSGCDDKSIAIWNTAPISAVKDSANCIHMQPLYFLSGPKAAIITMHPYVLEDGRLHGVFGCSIDKMIHYWNMKKLLH